jgi:hypothetical protein
MSSPELIQELQKLLNKHFETASGRNPNAANLPIFLPNKSCPSGLIPCDPNEGSCPDEDFALNPPIYTQDGLRCYTKEGVRKSRLSNGERAVVVTGVRALVEQLATLRDTNAQLDKAISRSVGKSDPQGSDDSYEIPEQKDSFNRLGFLEGGYDFDAEFTFDVDDV